MSSEEAAMGRTEVNIVVTASKPATRIEELERTCFLIMPFGKKDVGGKQVDFTAIYEEIFKPAIGQVVTPEGQTLIARRTDMDAFSGSINQDMFEYIMYSRLALADISGFNPNVFYEIGARHSAQESGTVMVRQAGHPIPFDITTIKVFEYAYETSDSAAESRQFITNVLSETMRRNRLDSPVRLALRAQWSGGPASGATTAAPALPGVGGPDAAPRGDLSRKQEVERFMRDAEEAMRIGDLDMARTNYWVALRFDPLNVIARMRLGLTLKRQGKYYAALEEFTTITKLAQDYGEAWKEKGVVEGLMARKVPADVRAKTAWMPDGYASLERATLLIPNDFDAWSSLGGVLKNVRQDQAGALKMYAHAARISDGHPYPLLNALKLEALQTGKLDLQPVQEQLKMAEKLRYAQTSTVPPTDTPWCFFDLAEIRLYRGDQPGFLESVAAGIASCDAGWQLTTFRDSLNGTLVEKGIDLPGLAGGMALLEKAIADNKPES